MVALASLLLTTSHSEISFDEVIRAHEAVMSCAVRISTTATSSSGSSTTVTEIWTDGFSQSRIWIRDERGPLYKIFSNDKSIQLLEVKSNRYIESPVIKGASVYENIISVAGGIDPISQIYLDAKIGMRRFLALFGKFEFEPNIDSQGEFRIKSPDLNVSAKCNLKTKLLESLDMTLGQSTVKWVISEPEIGMAQGLSSKLPSDASKVNNFSLIAEPTKTDSKETDKLMALSRTAYDRILTANISSRAQLWSPGGNQIRTSHCFWERGKKIRFDVVTDKPKTSFEASFDGKILRGIDRTKPMAFEANASAKEISKYLDSMNAQYEPMVICFIKGFNFWDRLIPAGASVKQAKEVSMVGTDKCKVIISTTSDGWTATIFVREKDHLIAKIERLLQPSSDTLYKETVTYNYQSINKGLPQAAWKLMIPPGVPVKKL